MGDWGFLSKLLDKVQSHSTNIGKVWLTVLLIFRIMVLGGVDKVWGDEQSNMVCNTNTPGCKNTCYDKYFPISHSRLWVLQIIFVSLPMLVYLGYALHVIHKEDKLRQRLAEKQETKLPKYSDANGKLQYKGNLLRIYVSCLVVTICFEAGFVCAQYYLFGFLLDHRFMCESRSCPHVVECFISRPTEKTIFILFMVVVSCVSLLLNITEIFYLICRSSVGKMHRRKYVTKETHC